MAYSRAEDDPWYAFHTGPAPGVPNDRDHQIFEICGIASFTYAQVKRNLEECLDEIRRKVRDVNATELGALRDYMTMFLNDVDAEFGASIS